MPCIVKSRSLVRRLRHNVIFAASVLLLLILGGCQNPLNSYPTDSLLEERFRSHQIDFNRLADMFKEDAHLSRISPTAAWVSYDVKASVPQQRFNEYRALFDKLKVKEIARGDPSGNFYILAWSKSDFIIGGSSKLYIYAETPPAPLVDSLDKLKNSGHDAYAFKKIADHWYMHLDIW